MEKDSRSDGNDRLRAIRELNVIIQIGQSIISSFDYDHVLQTISNGMSELLQIETSAIYTLEEGQKLWLGATTPPLPPGMPDELREAKLENHPHINKAITTQKPVLIPDTTTAQLSPEESMIVTLRNLRSLLFLPFVQEKSVLGVLILGTCSQTRTFGEHDVEVGQTVANQLAIAIQNSRLHKDLNSYKDNLEKLVVERTHELEAANEELKAMNEELHEKNKLVIQQKEELEAILQNLKSMQLKLFEAEKMASLGVLTAGVAHEINNPLNFIMGAYHGLTNFFTHKAPEHYQSVEVLLSSLKLGIDRVSAIVRGLNQFSRDSKTYNESCDIHAIIENCLVMIQNQIKHGINIRKQFSQERLIVKGNVGKLHQVFTNVLINSLQAIDHEGDIAIATQQDDNRVIISIADTGCGIKKEILPRVTEPFFTTKDPQKGTGLGLSISYNIIQEHNGQLEIESEEGMGTKVVISLPMN